MEFWVKWMLKLPNHYCLKSKPKNGTIVKLTTLTNTAIGCCYESCVELIKHLLTEKKGSDAKYVFGV